MWERPYRIKWLDEEAVRKHEAAVRRETILVSIASCILFGIGIGLYLLKFRGV